MQPRRSEIKAENWETEQYFHLHGELFFPAVLAFIGGRTIVSSLSNREKGGGNGTFNEAGIIKRREGRVAERLVLIL